MERHVLIVEDDPTIRDLLEETLRLESFDVTTATSVEEGLVAIEAGAYTVAIIDLKLPDGTGMKLVQRAREHGPGALIVVMTGYNEEILRRRADALGADVFIAKPFSPLDLLQAIEERQRAQA